MHFHDKQNDLYFEKLRTQLQMPLVLVEGDYDCWLEHEDPEQ
jgi:hypothetical protein